MCYCSHLDIVNGIQRRIVQVKTTSVNQFAVCALCMCPILSFQFTIYAYDITKLLLHDKDHSSGHANLKKKNLRFGSARTTGLSWNQNGKTGIQKWLGALSKGGTE